MGLNSFKRFLPLLLICSLTLTLSACGSTTSTSSSASSGTTATSAPTVTPTPTKALEWTTTHTFSGNGIQKTGTFTAPNDWKILWKCTPSSFYGGTYNVIVTVFGSDGSIQDIAINATCKAGNTSGSTEEHQGGQVYLDINSEGDWVIMVQELK